MASGGGWSSGGGKGVALLVGGSVLGGVLGITLFSRLPGVLVAVFVVVLFGGLGVYLYLMLAGNKAEVKATPAQRANALMSEPSPGAARAIFYRDGFVGRLLGVQITLDEQPVLQMKSPRFAVIEIAPGTHTLSAGGSGFSASQVNAGTMSFTVAAGQTAVFRIEIELGALKNTVKLIPDMQPALLPARLASVEMVLAVPEAQARG